MYRAKDTEEALLHVVGWEQDVLPSLQVKGGLTQSESGLTFQSAHPMCTLGIVNALVPIEWEKSIAAWKSDVKVYKGELKKHGGYYWKAKKNSLGQEPPADDFNGDFNDDFGNEYWQATNLLSEKAEQFTRRGIQNAVQKWMTTKAVNKESRTLLEKVAAFDGAGRLQNVVHNQDKIVGVEIVPVRGLGVTTKIEKVGLQFNGAGRVTLYLFHSSQSEPVYEYTCGYDRQNGSFKWFDLKDWYLPYLGPNGVGGSWYMVYVQRDLLPEDNILMEAVKVDFDWSNGPACQTCNAGMVRAWKEWSQFLKMNPFEVSTPGDWDKSEPKLWDIADNIYPRYNNYGLNLMVSVMCDVTDIIIQNRQQFAPVIQKQTVYEVLKAAETNPDVVVSRYQSNLSQTNVRYELDGNVATYKRGLGADLEKCYNALEVETQGIDKVCLGCNNRGIRYRTA